ncbi:hypothetical protein PENANT_c195G04734 [Penicillium antarcticum]|uniref:Uncharacterized protein n=1 Tax=Penicillium antarcticum TaxID=416450 RepID=A0A1V6P9T9_9EURO|nr:hypothetical protein PENANT_c195G04734 [Penicillium antarcticum]
MPYDRDEFVRELTAFYKFLVNTHIPDSALNSYVDPLEGYGVGIEKSAFTIANCIGRIGYYFLLDTKREAITMATPMEPIDPTDLSQNWDADDGLGPETWRELATYTAPNFVKMIMEEYRAFEVVQ